MQIDWLPVERVPEVQAFVDQQWRRGHVLARDETLLRWQHRRSRNPDQLAMLVAEDDGRFVAMVGFVEFDACVGGARVPGGWMTMWLVVPEARGRGLGFALVERALGSEYEFVGALDANDATRHVLGRHGFVERPMVRWVRVFDVEGLRALLRGEYRWDEQERSGVGEVPDQLTGACRDERFLGWRYERHPRFRYEVVRRGSRLAVYRIEQVRDSEARLMRVVDFLGDDDLASQLVAAAEREEVVLADFSCTSARFGAPLERAGFAREDWLAAPLPRRFQPLDLSPRPAVACFWAAPRLEVEFGGDDLYVTRADSDLDRPN